MITYLAVACGGAIGASARYALTLAMPQGALPWHTLLANLLGAFLIGALAGFSQSHATNDALRLFLQVGVLGGFTTFSTFALENLRLLESGAYLGFASYTLLSVGGALLCAALGHALLA